MSDDDLEDQCTEAVFRVCDAREYLATDCVEQLDNYLEMRNKLAMETVLLKPISLPDIQLITDAQIARTLDLMKTVQNNSSLREKCNIEVHTMLDQIFHLKAVVKQVEDNKTFEINTSR